MHTHFTSQCEQETGASFRKGVIAKVLIVGTTKEGTAAAALKGCVMMNRLVHVWEC